MDRATRLDDGVLHELGFRPVGKFWHSVEDDRISIKLDQCCFHLSIFGYKSEVAHEPTVGELEKLFFDITGKLLY